MAILTAVETPQIYPNLDPIVKRHVELDAKKKEIEAELKVLKEHLADNLPVGTHPIAGFQVSVKEPKVAWSAAGKREFTAQYPIAENPEFYIEVPQLDTSVAERVLTDRELAAYLLEPKKTVTVLK